MTCSKEQAQSFISMMNTIGDLSRIGMKYDQVQHWTIIAQRRLMEDVVKLAKEMGLTRRTFTCCIGSEDHDAMEKIAGEGFAFNDPAYDFAIDIATYFSPRDREEDV